MFRVIFFTIFIFILSFFAYNAITPGGIKTYCQDFSKKNYFIDKLTPRERVAMGNKRLDNVLIGNPVYFSLRSLRSFDNATLNLKYKNPDDLPLIEAGVLMDKTIWRYDLKGVENRLLEQLRYVWDTQIGDDLILLQREKNYESVEEFLKDLPASNKIALYNYDLDVEYFLSDYKKNNKKIVDHPIPSIRGDYQIFTYIKDEKLYFEFEFLDLNKNKDKDPIDMHLYYNNALIDSIHFDDDGIQTDSADVTEPRFGKFELENLPEGVYKIELRVNDDIVTKNIKTAQSKISFLNKVGFHREGEGGFKLYTDSKKVQVKTVYPDSLQNIRSGDVKMLINETYTQFEMDMPKISTGTKYHEIFFEKDGVIVTGDGVFSFSSDELINPKFKKADHNLDVNGGEVDYILAKYDYVKKDKEVRMASVVFDIKNAYRDVYEHQFGDTGIYGFLISVPDLKPEDKKQLIIEEICIKLVGKTLKEKVFGVFNY